jgi:hypothetical protein
MGFYNDLLYEKYYIIGKIIDIVSKLNKGDYPNGDRLCGSRVESLNEKYYLKLFKFACTIYKNDN